MSAKKGLLTPQRVYIGVEASSKVEVLDTLSHCLLTEGVVLPSFPEAVKERELHYPTGLPTADVGVAIPHADPEHVLQPAAALAIMAHPVTFGLLGDPDACVDVELVLMLAVRSATEQVGTLQRLVEAFQTPGFLLRLKSQHDPAAAARLLDACLAGEPA